MNAFTLWGEIKADTVNFESALSRAEGKLKQTEAAITQGEQKARQLGDTTAKTGRTYERFNEVVDKSRQRMLDAVTAYQRGDISAKKLASEFARVENNVGGLNSKLKDSAARVEDWSRRTTIAGSAFRGAFAALGLGGGLLMAKGFVEDSAKLFGTLDKLTRFTATLDKNFQSPENLKKFQEDIKKLSTEIPHSAESIAKASFQIKSAYQNITEPELIEFLREFGNAATASNTDIAQHAFNMAALTKQYGITKNELRGFSALMSTAFGNALATDSKVAEGFNRILASAKGTRQPLADMAAAMGTLQSASSDAEYNTTLLLNVYSKLTDEKYIQGIQDMGVAFYDTQGQVRPLNDLINDMAKSLEGLSDKEVNDKMAFAKDLQAREGLKTLVRLVEDYNKTLRDGADTEAFKRKTDLMLNSAEAKWQKLLNKVDAVKLGLAAAAVDFASIDWNKSIKESQERARGPAYKEGFTTGNTMADGIIMGFTAGLRVKVAEAATSMRVFAANIAAAAMTELQIRSPSRVFYEIGSDVGQGFVDGMEAMKEPVTKAASTMLDTAAVKKAIADQIKELKKEIADANASIGAMTSGKTVDLQKQAFDASRIKSTLEELVQLRLELGVNLDKPLIAGDLADKELKRLSSINDQISNLASTFNDFVEGDASEADKLIELFGNDEATTAITKQAAALGLQVELYKKLLLLAATKFKADDSVSSGQDAGRLTGDGPDSGGLTGYNAEELKAAYEKMIDIGVAALPAYRSWNTFWSMMQLQMAKWKQALPSMKQAIGENLLSSIERIGDVFGNAISQWDGTAKGFFRSLAQGFRQLIQQIVAELVRLMVVKAVLSLVGSLVGGVSGGGATAGAHGDAGFAEGGAVRGAGSGTSDSILARLSNGEFVMSAKAVKAYGANFFEGLNRGFSPMMPAFASGGLVGSSSSVTSIAPTININIQGGSGNAGQTADQVQRAVMNALNRYQQKNK